MVWSATTGTAIWLVLVVMPWVVQYRICQTVIVSSILAKSLALPPTPPYQQTPHAVERCQGYEKDNSFHACSLSR